MIYIQKDITTVTHGIIMQGVNCQNVMGSGVAKAIYTKWPVVKEAYHSMPKGRQQLGGTQEVDVGEGLVVINCWTQEYYGNDGKRYADIWSLAKALECAVSMTRVLELPYYMPKIGSDRGGLDWEDEVVPVIEAVEKEFEIEITICVQ